MQRTSSAPARPESARPPAKERSLAPHAPERGPLPDLLHARPSISVDQSALLHALSFAFVAGSAGGSLRTALSRTAIAASSFTPDTLSDGLFLDELLRIGFEFTSAGKPAPLDRAHLRKLISRPPSELDDVRQRQAILRELVADRELLQALERLYAAVSPLPGLLDDEGSDARLDTTQWRIDVLRALRDALLALDPAFGRASSELRRLHDYGEHVRGSRGFQQLQALLEYEGDAARADLVLRLGADGKIRTLEIVALRERRESQFHVGPLRRFLARFWAWLQGYRIGPMEVVDRWLESVFDGVREQLPALLQLKLDLEFYLSALHFKSLAEARGLSVCLPELVLDAPRSRSKRLEALWNPLLLGGTRAPVPTDVSLPNFAPTCITTGPNSGGKTRFLQALALCQLLGQAGLFVAARSAQLRPLSGMFVSLGEAPHADQKEGRLGMELVRIRRLFEQAHAGSFVVLDELCSGTNPSEGEEIFRMLLELLHELAHEVHITTHFLSFAHALQSESDALGLSFLQVELDVDQHATYRFVPGVATTSLAQQTAERLGVTRDQLRSLLRRQGS
ncbi:MAG TPA: DNA mismatch repair protein [Polyangiales bacterium]|nr:DNA mismatch repair protein [Polyangiales bacterium]